MFTKTIPFSLVAITTFCLINGKIPKKEKDEIDVVVQQDKKDKKTEQKNSDEKIKHVKVLRHPLANHLITYLRNTKTTPDLFRSYTNKLTTLLVLEATKSIKTKKTKVQTPIQKAKGKILDQGLAFIPILRSGLSMIESAIQLFPDVVVGHIGMQRDETTSKAKQYYCKLPSLSNRAVFCFDPMLATGGTATQVIKILKEKGASEITMVSVIAAPEGIKKLQKDHPELKIVVAAIDEKLNEKNYIVPGLGDFGDRLYGTLADCSKDM